MTPEVKTAIDEITATFKGCELETVEDGSGGAIVNVRSMSLEKRQLIFKRTRGLDFISRIRIRIRMYTRSSSVLT